MEGLSETATVVKQYRGFLRLFISGRKGIRKGRSEITGERSRMRSSALAKTRPPGLIARDREKDRQRGLLVWVVSDLLHEKR